MQVQHPQLRWQVEDIRALTLSDSTIDVAIDKVGNCAVMTTGC